ncbi:methyltransferase domain-containing protein [Streptomyces sp. H10-C2]|uniref:methyltransferase domain-containing protein n=1 Tax=unclassified Streptomyces TaxID=2593676 RepID=UPI0024B8E3B9|nr:MULTISPECIES: methyltransferase domain-containing protein [unclassified Streptomyces]MDJ0344739.1 methyltransferase domain-containing protein [Streptomyces sp. PH10-H1]MDJ0371230.1 methyltransferase domain-containing protein [Streptomyces sp. H10-C2]
MGDVRPTSAFHTDNITDATTGRLVGALDTQAASAGVRRLREWAHRGVAARPGERAVDIGAGTGSETLVLAAAVTPGGEAIGVEPNPGLRSIAEQRAAEAGNPARFVDGDASSLPLGDADVDVVWCERVFQHLSEPDRAAAEIARVLRPGGRVALLDTDWATSILHPGDPEVVAALTTGALATAVNPYAGRRLAGQLAAAGLEIDDLGSQALIQDPSKVTWPLIRMLGEAAVRRELITERQRDQLYDDLTAAAKQGAVHMSVTMFGVIAHRPA